MQKYKWNRFTIISAILISVVMTAGCITIEAPDSPKRPSNTEDDKSSTIPSGSQNTNLPVIISFAVNPGEVPPGEESTLSWEVANANSITISPKIGDVSASGSLILTPTESTVYTLVATNASGELKVTTELKVATSENARFIALTSDDVIANGFTFVSDSIPVALDALSTYSITFIRGEEILNNIVYIYPSFSLAQQYYYGTRAKNNTLGQDIYSIREQKAFVVSDKSPAPDNPEKFTIRFTKRNVYVELGHISAYKELENYALIMEARIK
jgi:hypothetical protein